MKLIADEKRKLQHATITAEFNAPMTGPEAEVMQHLSCPAQGTRLEQRLGHLQTATIFTD